MNKSFQLGWWLILLTIVCMYAISLPVIWFFPTANEYTVSILGEAGILIPIIIGILYLAKNNYDTKTSLGITGFSPRLLIPSVILTLGAQTFILYITLPVQTILIILFGVDTATSQMLVPTDLKTFVLAFSAVCIAAPVFEELLCRGILIKLFEKYGSITAIIYSAAAFALLHFEVRSIIPIFFLGVLFAILRLCTGSTILTIILHSVNNLFALCQLILMNTKANTFITSIALVCAFAFPFMLYYLLKKLRKYFKHSSFNMQHSHTGFSLAALICFLLFFAVNLLLLLQRLINGDCTRELMQLMGLY